MVDLQIKTRTEERRGHGSMAAGRLAFIILQSAVSGKQPMHTMQTATLSIITATKPARLSKGFSFGGNGGLLKSPGGNLVQGEGSIIAGKVIAE